MFENVPFLEQMHSKFAKSTDIFRKKVLSKKHLQKVQNLEKFRNLIVFCL
jgi:hypothetical protein